MPASKHTAYRVLFAAAAAYNLVFALASGFFPQRFFSRIDIETPADWTPIAIVIGSFAILYAFAALWPERGDLAVTMGLATKMLGPIAWLCSVLLGQTSVRLFPLVLVGDLLWWLPFAAYLLRGSPRRGSVLAAWCCFVHVAANVGLLLIGPGTELNPDMAQRQRFVLQSPGLWITTWFLWSLASISLLGFCVVWAARLNAQRRWTTLALAIIGAGVAFDLAGETVLVVQATRGDLTVADFATAVRRYQWFSPILANGLYCVGGSILSVISWKSHWLRGWLGVAGFAVWVIGLGLSLAAVLEHRLGMIVFGGGLMLLFVPWSLAMTFRFWGPSQLTSSVNPADTKASSTSDAPSNS